MPDSKWLGDQRASLCQTLMIPKEDEYDINTISRDTGLSVTEILGAAIQTSLQKWLLDPENIEKNIRQDLMLAKLYRR